MADKHEIEITIDDDGNVSFEVKGVKGKKCLEITKDLEEALGMVKSREHTGDYYQTDVSQTGHIGQSGA
ncbi:MAG: DUF2997 domain-containing protein [Planctomycetota bacterium]|jgi:hypothetical protein